MFWLQILAQNSRKLAIQKRKYILDNKQFLRNWGSKLHEALVVQLYSYMLATQKRKYILYNKQSYKKLRLKFSKL